MKIKLKENYVAILKEESGDVVGVFNSTNDARRVLEQAVEQHFDWSPVGLCDSRDFVQPFDYEQPYEFVLYKTGKNEYVTLTMTFTPIY